MSLMSNYYNTYNLPIHLPTPPNLPQEKTNNLPTYLPTTHPHQQCLLLAYKYFRVSDGILIDDPFAGISSPQANPYLTGVPPNQYNPYFTPAHLMPTIMGPADPSGQLAPVHTQAVPVNQQKIPRSDRLEVSVDGRMDDLLTFVVPSNIYSYLTLNIPC